MAVPDWPGTYGYNLFLYPWATWLYGPFDLFAEHGHRLLGALVGVLAIGLAVTASLWERRRWVIALCWFELLAVIGQGALGGFRVLRDERSMAMLHGCTAAAFFALATTTAVITSHWWKSAQPIPKAAWLTRILVVILPIAAFCQLVIGAQLRHIQPWAGPYQFIPLVHLHLTLAVLVTLLIMSVAMLVRLKYFRDLSGMSRPTGLLVLLVWVQLMLGVATWVANYALPWAELSPELARYTIVAKGYWESWIVTGHQATGSLIIAIATVTALRFLRQQARPEIAAAA
jgi:cytochrome c oxidase assembly protein subunit 15